jgi:hypothetical protein
MLVTAFEGTFKPPIIGSTRIPINISGSGQCEVTSDGLKIKGFRRNSKINSSQLFILFFIVFFGLIITKVILKIYAKIEISDQLIVAILLFSCFYPFILGSGTDHQGELIQLLIPWEYISGARLDKQSMCVVILVKKFQHQNEIYKGELFFHPSDGTESFLIVLRAKLVKC